MHRDTPPRLPPDLDVKDRMAFAVGHLIVNGADSVTHDDLRRYGFTDAQVRRFASAASQKGQKIAADFIERTRGEIISQVPLERLLWPDGPPNECND